MAMRWDMCSRLRGFKAPRRGAAPAPGRPAGRRGRDGGLALAYAPAFGWRLGLALLVLGLGVTACGESAPEPTRGNIRALIPTATPRAGGFGGSWGADTSNTWLYGTATPTRTPTGTGTPGPSPTPTFTPTPINAETLKGQLLFLSSRGLPASYAPPTPAVQTQWIAPDAFRAFQGAGGVPVWRFDPATYRVAPCEPPPERGGTPAPGSPPTPTPMLLFNDLPSFTQARGPGVCPPLYDAARQAQTFSADKRFEVYVAGDPAGGRPQIWVLDHLANTKTMLTRFGSGVSYDPVFAPDGYRLAFISQERAGVDNLYSITRDGTDLQRLTRRPGQDWETTWEWVKRPTWSADGTQLAFWSNKVSGAREIWLVNADGTNLHTISNDPRPGEDWDPVWVR